MKFMNMPEEYSKEESYFQILPIEYEKDLTYGEGASKGPFEIIKASQHLEYYDEQFDNEPFLKGIHTLQPLVLSEKEPEEVMKAIEEEVKKQNGKFLISLGGDHSVTIGAIRDLDEDCSVIILDAHSDMFHSWNNSQYNHRCVAQRTSQKHDVLIVGVRSMDADEADIIKNNDNVNIIKAYDYNIEKLKQELKKLKNKVYISIDVDCFDTSFIRNTGTPEPGGFLWYDIINILKEIFSEKEVIGADVVEFSPKENFYAEAFSLAKLCYKLMALKLR